MHVVITFPRVVQRHSTCKMKLKILSQKSQNFFLCCKFARVIIKREGGPKSFCPTCQELSKNLLQFFSLSSFYLAKAGGSRKKFSSNSWCPQKLGRKAKNRLKLASQSFDLSAENLHSLRGWLMDDIIFCTQSTLTLVPKVWNFVTFDYCIFPSWKAFFDCAECKTPNCRLICDLILQHKKKGSQLRRLIYLRFGGSGTGTWLLATLDLEWFDAINSVNNSLLFKVNWTQ